MSAAFRCWPTTDNSPWPLLKDASRSSPALPVALATGPLWRWQMQGAHVIAVARTTGGLEELDDAIQASGGSATLVPMDLTDMPAIDRLGGAINERWGKLDILVANAACSAPFLRSAMSRPRFSTRSWQSTSPPPGGDPLSRTAFEEIRCRPGADPVVGRRPFRTRLLGPLRGLQGRRRDPGAGLGGGNRKDRTQGQFRSIQAPPARRCGHLPCRAKIPRPCRIRPKLPKAVAALPPECTETGRLFRVKENRFFDYRLPE
jgi:hypothetical protein